MSNSQPMFDLFKIAQKSLRGTGLGRIIVLRKIRDIIYDMVRPREEMLLDIHGVSMYVDPNQSGVVPDLLRDGIFEKCETGLVRSVLREGDVFVDVGSNIGYYSLLAAQIVGDSGRVFAFEPEPENYRYLEKNVAANKFRNVTLEKKALSDKAESQRLFLTADNSGGHHLADRGDGAPSVSVETITLDQYFANSAQRIDLLKMDIEGYEPFAFRGMQSTLKANPSVKLIIEYYPKMIQKAGNSPDEFLEQLLGLGFSMSLINEITQKVTPTTRDAILEYCRKLEYANLFCSR